MSLDSISWNISSLEEQTKTLNKTYKDSVDIVGGWVDKFVWFLWRIWIPWIESVNEKYQKQMERIRQQARQNIVILKAEVEKGLIKTNYTVVDLQKRADNLTKAELWEVSFLEAVWNTDMRSLWRNTYYGIKWEVVWVYHWLKWIVTCSVDLAIFIGKYVWSSFGYHPEYKTKIDEQATQIYSWVKKEWFEGMWNKIYELLGSEMTRIQKLPEKEQAEAIGNIAGNIIAMLTAIKAWTMIVEKTTKVARQLSRGGKLLTKAAESWKASAERIARLEALMSKAKIWKNVLETANTFLNWVAESLIWAWLAKTLWTTLLLLKSKQVTKAEKLFVINNYIEEAQNVLKTENNSEVRQKIEETVMKLREEKVKIERPNQNIEEIKINANLSKTERIEKVNSVLWITLSPEQEKVIIDTHNKLSKWIFWNDLATIRKMNIELKKAWFSKEEIRILMEKWILWNLTQAERTWMIDRITWLFGWEKIDAIKSSKSVTERAELARELWIVPRFVGKNIEDVNQILRWEIEIIQNAKQSLWQILKWMDWSDRSLVESLLKRSNEWISVRLANLEKFIIFIEEATPWTMNEINLVNTTIWFKEKLLREGLIPLWKTVTELNNSWKLLINTRNEVLLNNHYERLRWIKPHKISN